MSKFFEKTREYSKKEGDQDNDRATGTRRK